MAEVIKAAEIDDVVCNARPSDGDADRCDMHACSIHSVGHNLSVDLPSPRKQSTISSLPSHVDRSLVRAAPVTEVLSGFGRHWSSNVGTADDYSLSKPVDEVDVFLSHDWGTGRLHKTVGLCFFFNRWTAFVASCVCAVPLAYLGSSPSLPVIRGEVAKLVCPIIYFAVYAFGQRLSLTCRKPSDVFLDKLCIHQTDEELKTAGILGLAGFLRASRQLVILWSPRYFSRLWCMYELVAWCYLHGLDSGRICFLPVAWCMFQCLSVFCFSADQVMKLLFKLLEDFSLIDSSSASLGSLVAGLLLWPLVYRKAMLIRELSLVQDQIRGFAIRNSHCFCCTHEHVHPQTGQKMACDRQLVHATLRKWHARLRFGFHLDDELEGEESSNAQRWDATEDEALDSFDAAVRRQLTHLISRSMHGAFLCLSYKDCVSIAAPFFWSGLDAMFLAQRDGLYLSVLRCGLCFSVMPLFVFPLSFATGIKIILLMVHCTAGFQSSLAWTVLTCAAGSTVFLVILYALWIPVHLTRVPGEEFAIEDIVLVLYYFGLACVTKFVVQPAKHSSKPDDEQQDDKMPVRIALRGVESVHIISI
eukprot:TRINITY_DN8944_c2_g1_i1.p1 TRINITY_DN8944_c2_g1~~TRINITY_DN8944_c2_g1_i1.p1  ORF type:complete len:611 (-),score=68.43 TRINITY_DN8944_c2_g1_i1:242-2002(-)